MVHPYELTAPLKKEHVRSTHVFVWRWTEQNRCFQTKKFGESLTLLATGDLRIYVLSTGNLGLAPTQRCTCGDPP
ncbi:hypothetical protein LINGRAHAP2_LOCUS4446 [Linum grandiflorum]